MTTQLRDEEVKTPEQEVKSVKETLSYVLREKALSPNIDSDKSGFMYLVASILDKMEVKSINIDIILGTTGDTLYVGTLFKKFKEKFTPEQWRKLLIAMIVHEALHVMYGHEKRMMLVDDPKLYNIVADLLVNTVIERKLGIKLPNELVTLESLPDFIKERTGKDIDEKLVLDIADKYISGKLSTEDVYRIFEDPALRNTLTESFSKSRFLGNDMTFNKQQSQTPKDKEEAQEKTEQQKPQQNTKTQHSKEPGTSISQEALGEQTEQNKDQQVEQTREIKIKEASELGEEIEKKLEQIQKELEELKETLRKIIGQYEALKSQYLKNRGIGTLEGIYGEQEYRKIRQLTIKLKEKFLNEIGESISDYETTFIRYSDDAYWLPDEEEIHTPRVLLLIDSSPSIKEKELNLFMHFVVSAINTFNIEYMVSVFSVDEIQYLELSKDNLNESRLKLYRGGGTVWGNKIAERIRTARLNDVKLIQILSDFEVAISKNVIREIEKFKSTGGKISCYSVTGKYMEFCDYKYMLKLP